MQPVLGRFAPQLYAILRVVAGLLFACHGAQKLFGLFGGTQVSLMSQFGLAGVIEFAGGLMIALGFFTSIVAFIASGEMAFAYFYVHVMQLGAPPMGPGLPAGLLVPQMNRGVDAMLFCFAFLYIAARGPGLLSLDQVFGKRRT